jgi:hypothetical protein
MLTKTRVAMALAFAAHAPAQQVLVVAPMPGPGVHSTVIQTAVDAAASGDIVLVRAGTYAPFKVSGKSLVVAADPAVTLDAGVSLDGLVVRSIAAHQSVVIRGFALSSSFATSLSIVDCAGPVTIEDGAFAMPFPTSAFFGAAAIARSARVTLVRCDLRGGTARFATIGLGIGGSAVHLWSCTVRGGYGPNGMPGAAAAVVTQSFVSLNGSQLQGGDGAPGALVGTFCIPAQDGGDALFLTDPQTQVSVLGTALLPGRAGTPGQGCPPANPGLPVSGSGTAVVRAGQATSVTQSSPLRAGQNANLALFGPPGATAWLAFAPRQDSVFVGACNGAFLVDLATTIPVLLGALPASGLLTVTVPVPASLPARGALLFVQPVFTDPSPACFVGAPTALVLLDRVL